MSRRQDVTMHALLVRVGLPDVAAVLGRLGVVFVPREPTVPALQQWHRREQRKARREGR